MEIEIDEYMLPRRPADPLADLRERLGRANVSMKVRSVGNVYGSHHPHPRYHINGCSCGFCRPTGPAPAHLG